MRAPVLRSRHGPHGQPPESSQLELGLEIPPSLVAQADGVIE
jgi:hypothetical protein